MASHIDDNPTWQALSRSQWLSLALTALVAFGVGLLVGLSLAGRHVGQPPAIEMAREVGLALPIQQQPAFADGAISRAEIEGAIERLAGCVEARGVTGFTAALVDEGTGFHMESLGGSQIAVELCRLEHFEATYTVWSQQERSKD